MSFGLVSFTTDYGTADGFVAACKGVLATKAPGVRVIDVTHEVPAQDVRRGAAVLAQTVPWLPPAVHLAVVDPGVGTDRRGVAIVTPRGILVGPDNGLLVPAAEALGGIEAAYELAEAKYHLPVVTATFHGRDVFAPVSAQLCLGLEPSRLGPPAADLVRLPAPVVRVGAGELRSEVLTVDRFGNVQLAATETDLAAAGLTGAAVIHAARVGRPGPDTAGPAPDAAGVASGEGARVGRTFGDVGVGELLVLPDSDGFTSIAVNRGDAAARLGLAPGDEVVLRRPEP
ncbi:MAG TPA: SAM-dependent chlorinase/fluorinase [Mycobacteriales bacterium]|nr:SAM-dependent chlorinase/fluorinase [Mycobacteriales bacterium]